MTTKRVFIGRTPEGEKFYLETEVQQKEEYRTSINHEPLESFTTLSMSGVLISKYGSIARDGNWISCGQNLENLKRVRDFRDSDYRGSVSELVSIWERWHLNDLKAKCAHQNPATSWDECEPCSASGYRAGSAWLVEEIPSEVLNRVYELGLIHTGDYARVVMERVATSHPLSEAQA